MSYAFRPAMRYRMPTHFGPSPGPRQAPDGRGYPCIDNPRQTILRAAFQADPAALEELLPPRFELLRPELSLSFSYLTDVEWLAGRGYNTFGVAVPARFRGSSEIVEGELLLVLWENMADPIVTGREELGFAKVYCELPPLAVRGDRAAARAHWDGHLFAELEVSGLGAPAGTWSEPPASHGLLHYKYVPRTGSPGESDAEYPVLTPASGAHFAAERSLVGGAASSRFLESTFDQLPTLFHIVNVLAAIPLGPCIAADLVEGRGAKDLSDQRILT